MGSPYAEVIGDPIAHSKSPAIHKFWLETLGLPGDYRATRVTEAEVGDYFAVRRKDPDWRGCNVTMPLKMAVQAFLDRVDEPARRIGAVNTVTRNATGLLTGKNTDWQGVHFALDNEALAARNAAIIGTGGGARAALEEMRNSRVRNVALVSRSPDKAEALLADFGMDGDVRSLDAALETDLLINASPLGMAGHPPLEIDLSSLPPNAVVMDMVYNPRETALLRRARSRGLRTADGLSMLIGQAASAFTCFFGERPDNPFDTPALRERLLA
jgi:shikimate dehydrogenase